MKNMCPKIRVCNFLHTHTTAEAMEMHKPSWLYAAFVEKVLQKADNDESIEVSSIIVRPATVKGDNCASDIYRVSVELSRIHNGSKIIETRSVIAKLELQGGATKEMVTKNGLFEREISMLMEILPTMNEMLAKFSETPLNPRCLQIQYENPMHLIIEDLAPKGFQLANGRENLDLDHCLLVMRNIAVFHAVSVALAEKDPNALRKYKRSSYLPNRTAQFEEFMRANVKAVGEEAAKWPELDPRISEKLLKLAEVNPEKECQACLFLEDDFNVLNHGDCWFKNILFRYNEEQKPIELIFVDFQLSHYGSPAIDILFFFGSSTSVDVRLERRELLVREYHKSLTSNMTKLKCSTRAPSFDDLRDILRKRAFCEVTVSFVEVQHSLPERKNTGELLTQSENPHHSHHRANIRRNVMTRVLPFFDSLGLLDA